MPECVRTSLAGFVLVTSTNLDGLILPVQIPPVYSSGSRVSTPGIPLGTYRNLPFSMSSIKDFVSPPSK